VNPLVQLGQGFFARVTMQEMHVCR
jgi:hypothetical protein